MILKAVSPALHCVSLEDCVEVRENRNIKVFATCRWSGGQQNTDHYIDSTFFMWVKKYVLLWFYAKGYSMSMCWMKLIISVDIILMAFRQQNNLKQNSVQSVMWPQLQHEMVKGQLRKFTKSRFSWQAAKGLVSNWGALPAFSHDRTRPLWRLKCHGLKKDHYD